MLSEIFVKAYSSKIVYNNDYTVINPCLFICLLLFKTYSILSSIIHMAIAASKKFNVFSQKEKTLVLEK